MAVTIGPVPSIDSTTLSLSSPWLHDFCSVSVADLRTLSKVQVVLAGSLPSTIEPETTLAIVDGAAHDSVVLNMPAVTASANVSETLIVSPAKIVIVGAFGATRLVGEVELVVPLRPADRPPEAASVTVGPPTGSFHVFSTVSVADFRVLV